MGMIPQSRNSLVLDDGFEVDQPSSIDDSSS